MAISFEEIGQTVVTFAAEDTLEAGKVCKITRNGTVGACEKDESFCGVAAQVRGAAAGVVTAGYVELPYSGEAPTLGYTALAADADGGVCVKADGRTYLVVQVDTQDKIAGLFL